MDSASLVLTDEQALESIGIYPRWEELVGKSETVTKGFRFRYGEKLYKVVQPEYTFTEVYVPGVGTESLFARVEEGHSGTQEDPIPYDTNMEIFEGLHYTQYDVLYRCTRSSGQPLYHDLANLVGVYEEVVA
jgi:hypothetical protein